MTSEEFNRLTPAQAYQGVELCVRNCELHLFIARSMVSDSELVGLANSHCILGYEEAIKGIFLFFRATENQLNIDVRKMFKSHAHKHEFGKEHFHSFYNDAMKILTGLTQRIDIEKETNPNMTEEYRSAADYFQSKIKLLTDVNVDEILPDIIKWFNNADQQKSRGFYVDYKIQKGWQSPQAITMEEYKFSLFIAETIGLLSKLFLTIEQLRKEKTTDSPGKTL